ncbi:MAG: phage portal protein [Bacteroidales bacterium]|nr:phage portal protein [Bacteroidales bacterium]
MWKRIWYAIRGIIEKMFGKTIEQALGILPIMSSKMEEAIDTWDKMYRNEADWLHEPSAADPIKIVSLGIPSFIASEKARCATIEMKSVITEPNAPVTSVNTQITQDTPTTTRAEYLNKQYQLHLIPHIRRELEYGIAKGGLIFKPYVYNDVDIAFTFCQADEFFPISFDTAGKMTEAAFVERFTNKNIVFTRLEYHKLNKDNSVTVVNKAFKSYKSDGTKDELGTEVALTSVPAWEDIPPVTTINGVDRLLFAYFKMPDANTIDTTSPLGVSAYARAVKLIREADLQYSRLVWEYEGGQMAIDVDRDALKVVDAYNAEGKVVRQEKSNILQARLFRKVDLNSDETYNVFNPSLRDTNYISGLNNILMRIEDTVGLSRGTLSDITRSEAKTATEMLILRQRSYSANADIQKSLQAALDDCVYVMNVYASLYKLAPEGEYSISYEWDDSLINSPEEELQRRLLLMQSGLESKVNLRMWYYGETEDQAIQELAKVQQEALANAQLQAIATGMVQAAQPQSQTEQQPGKTAQPQNPNSQGGGNK